jgi:formylglycine-generating enzyme required for sulfatase activity/serine/threonine protein kinase
MSRPDPLGLVGTTIAEKYAVEAVVGEGGFAVVYRATHVLWKRPVAVKVFKALGDVPEADRQRLLEEFIREGALLAELSERSAAIVQARDIGTVTIRARGGAETIPYMVLEWLEGDTLEAVLEKERKEEAPLRSIEAAMKLLEPAAHALSLAHSKGIAHRDVKPANVFVLGHPRADETAVKLLDFGIAKVVSDVQKAAGAFSKTSGNATSFTPLYGAPEQFNRQVGATGPWTDVFALALVTMDVVTGREGLEGEDIVQLAFSSGNPARRPTPRTCGASVSDAVEEVFAKAVAVSPADRYQTAGEFWNALRIASGMGAMPNRLSSLPAVPTSELRRDSSLAVARTQLEPTPGGLTRASQPPIGLVAAASPTTGSTALEPVDKRWGPALIIGGVVIIVCLAGLYVAKTLLGDGGPPSTPVPTTSGTASASPAPSGSAPLAAMGGDAGTCPAGMVRVPGGDFYMGSDDKGALDHERPAHPVHVDAYCLDVTETTVAAYNACSTNGKCIRAAKENDWPKITPDESKFLDPLCNANKLDEHAQHPINCVSWQQAKTFCEAAGGRFPTISGGRLPTEAEWEFAARGSDGRIYPWGDEAPNAALLNACGKECGAWQLASKIPVGMMYPNEDDGFPATAPVKSFPKGQTRFGNFDMAGNVWEWTADYYAPYTKESASGARVANPKGPADAEAASGSRAPTRVIRGGAFNGAVVSWVRPTFRYFDLPEKKSYGIGFRCARSL